MFHVVCTVCGARWTTESIQQPRQCQNEECEAGWTELPMFADVADADRTAKQAKRVEEIAAQREP